ncbi:hypothetical protein IAR55_001122 [Kwoniella newhampshirensis]|uniref:F-box domain-containing protein n=1 Tax=Kwoniella newhampshirensis TaxID=1651941 RepID=A0AAW0Z4Y5_9TREE
MSRKSLAKEYQDMGMKYWKEGNYEEAWKNFDKALNFAGKDLTLMDFKAAAMCKLPAWRRNALEVSNEVIKNWPQSYKGYFRRASILSALKQYDMALTMIQRAVELGPTQAQNQTLYTTLQRLRSRIIVEKDNYDRAKAAKDEGERLRQEATREAARRSRVNYIQRLSPDVLLSIAEHGMADYPGFVSKMAGVCRLWRGILVNQKSLWNKLVLGKKRVMEKVKVYTERTEGLFMEIVITDAFDTSKTDEVVTAIRPFLKNVRRLDVTADSRTIETLLSRWKGRFRQLRDLHVELLPNSITEFRTPVMVNDVACGLLDTEARSLMHVQLNGISISQRKREALRIDTQGTVISKDDQAAELLDPVYWMQHPEHIASIRTLSLVHCVITSAWPDLSDLLRLTPQLTALSTQQTATYPMPEFTDWVKMWRVRGRNIVVPELQSYSACSYSNLIRFEDVSVPSLQHVDLWKASPFAVSGWFSARGLEAARSTLVSLDLGHCAVDQAELLSVLAKLPGLRFLNVSYCSVDNTFIEALERKGDATKDSLPNLVALSIAGNADITSGALRRLVLSRLPGGLKTTSSSSQPGIPSARSSAFRPTAPPTKASPFAPSRPKPATVIVTPIPQVSSTSIVQPFSSSRSSTLPALNWLCIDHCERIESEFPDLLRKKVRFVSHNLSAKPTDMRIRGKGRWAWDADFTGDCGRGESGCMLRRTPGTRDGWHVHHTCGIDDVSEEEPGWTKSQGTAPHMGSGGLRSAVSLGSWDD